MQCVFCNAFFAGLPPAAKQSPPLAARHSRARVDAPLPPAPLRQRHPRAGQDDDLHPHPHIQKCRVSHPTKHILPSVAWNFYGQWQFVSNNKNHLGALFGAKFSKIHTFEDGKGKMYLIFLDALLVWRRGKGNSNTKCVCTKIDLFVGWHRSDLWEKQKNRSQKNSHKHVHASTHQA